MQIVRSVPIHYVKLTPALRCPRTCKKKINSKGTDKNKQGKYVDNRINIQIVIGKNCLMCGARYYILSAIKDGRSIDKFLGSLNMKLKRAALLLVMMLVLVAPAFAQGGKVVTIIYDEE